jgi:hypothetical protein
MGSEFEKLKLGDIVKYKINNSFFYGLVLEFGYIDAGHSYDGNYVKIYWFHNAAITDVFVTTFDSNKCFKIT